MYSIVNALALRPVISEPIDISMLVGCAGIFDAPGCEPAYALLTKGIPKSALE